MIWRGNEETDDPRIMRKMTSILDTRNSIACCPTITRDPNLFPRNTSWNMMANTNQTIDNKIG